MRFLISILFLATVGISSATDVTYKGQMASLLKAKCSACHGGLIPQGGLRVNSLKNLKKGGKTGPAFVAGNAEASLMYQQFFLPLTDVKHMPPNGAPQLTEAEIALFRDWINQGAQ